MKIIYITAGHQPKGEVGATSKYGIEGIETRKLTIDIAKLLYKEYGIMTLTDDDSWILKNVINWISKKAGSGDFLLDIHFDAFNGIASGSTTFIPDIYTLKEHNVAKGIVDITSKELQINNRGVKTESLSNHKKLGILSDHRITKPSNVLWEVCFIDNKTDMESFRDNRTKLIESVGNFINSIL